MKSKKIKSILKVSVIAILVTTGCFIGYYFGDLILSNSTEIRSKDIIECRVGLPVLIGAIFLYLSLLVTDMY